MRKRFWACLLALVTVFAAGHASAGFLTRDELRAAYRGVTDARFDGSPYAVLPDVSDLESTGALTEAARQSALDELNFIRAIAGLGPVASDPLYDLRAQNAAYLLSVNDAISHHPERPAGMSEALYESGRIGALCSDIAMFARTDDEVLIDSVIHFARDDGDRNLDTLSHRRWMLNPAMSATGFGLSCSSGGSTYAAMYAVDMGNTNAEWNYIAWPSAGAFPVEMMRAGLAWSVSLNEEVYRVPEEGVTVRLTERNSGLSFAFESGSDTADGFCRLDDGAYGSGVCVIFRPNLEGRNVSEYVQNQRWHAEIAGLRTTDDGETSIAYECDMFSLYPQDAANVEIAPLEARVRVGETTQLTAVVIPEYADDCTVRWVCDDPCIALVDENGRVTALSPGICHVRALSRNDRFDECEITVE